MTLLTSSRRPKTALKTSRDRSLCCSVRAEVEGAWIGAALGKADGIH